MTMLIKAIPAFTDNYIWTLINEGNGQAIVIDPGQAQPVESFLTEHNLELTAIWITHHHFDHTGGVSQLQQAYPMTHVVAHSDHGVDPDQTVNEGSTVNAWGHPAQVWEIAGHTDSHIAYVLDQDSRKHVFCGDTLFSGGCGKVFSGSIEQLYASFERLKTLPERTLLYPAHEYTVNNLRFGLSIEPDNQAMRQALQQAEQMRAQRGVTLPVTLAHEREINVFMRTDQPELIKRVAAKTELSDHKPLGVFAALRQLKDNF